MMPQSTTAGAPLPSALWANAINASVPPSPRLSARSRISTYFSVTTMISAHRLSAPQAPLFEDFSAMQVGCASDRDLGPNLDHASGRDLVEIGGVARRFCQADEQVILPARHAGMRGWLERAARKEERRRHDIEM